MIIIEIIINNLYSYEIHTEIKATHSIIKLIWNKNQCLTLLLSTYLLYIRK